jgi:hypothetical protein
VQLTGLDALNVENVGDEPRQLGGLPFGHVHGARRCGPTRIRPEYRRGRHDGAERIAELVPQRREKTIFPSVARGERVGR